MNYTELQKCYPEFKIPVPQHADYYIDTLLKAGYVNKRPIDLLYTLELNQDIYLEKKTFMNGVLQLFKDKNWDISKSSWEHYDSTYTELEFNDFKPNKSYVSIDLRSANWQAFKHALYLDLPEWEEWLMDTELRPHPFYAESKSIRQYIFGNTNPKRLQKVQKWMMQQLIDKMPTVYKEAIVGKKSDELILEFDKFPTTEVFGLNYIPTILPFNFKTTFFNIELVTNFGDVVKIKNELNTDGTLKSKKFIGLQGNRFFIHLKTLLMNKELDERDTLFLNDGWVAKWLL